MFHPGKRGPPSKPIKIPKVKRFDPSVQNVSKNFEFKSNLTQFLQLDQILIERRLLKSQKIWCASYDQI